MSIVQGYEAATRRVSADEKKVILASSLGTVFEFYDLYLYGALSAIIAKQFFSGVDPTAAFIFSLLAFAAGFAVRPLGAVIFGRLGDLMGRKYTFLMTIVLMGGSTVLVGVLPNYSSWGIAAPTILIILRLLQGLAVGGEYGGAVIYVAEHAPQGRRAFYTSFIQTTATLGLILSLLVILAVRLAVGEDAFGAWGWRIPFLFSIVLLGISVWIRLLLDESPTFKRLKAEGKVSKAPLSEAFGSLANLKIMALVVFLVAGQAVIWYTGQFYVLFFLTQTLKVDAGTANMMMIIALLIGTPFFLVFGALADRIGRKPVILAGCIFAALTYFPVFKALTHYANPALEVAIASAPIRLVADPETCSFQFNPVGTAKFTSPCDITAAVLTRNSVSYSRQDADPGQATTFVIGDKSIEFPAIATMEPAQAKIASDEFSKAATAAIQAAGYPSSATPADINKPAVVFLLVVLIIGVTLAYGPLGGMLVELFPTRIRYTAMSLPYNISSAWFGGFLPASAFAMVSLTGDIYFGLWYPITIVAISGLAIALFIPETKNVDIDAE